MALFRRDICAVGALALVLVCASFTGVDDRAAAGDALQSLAAVEGGQRAAAGSSKKDPLVRRLQAASESVPEISQRRVDAIDSQAMAESREKCFGAPRPFAFGVPVAAPKTTGPARKFSAGIFAARNRGRFVTSRRGLGETDSVGAADAGGVVEEEDISTANNLTEARRRLLAAKAPPLHGKCSREKVKRSLRPGEDLLRACLSDPQNCGDVTRARELVQSLSGIQAMAENIPCLMINKDAKCKQTMNVKDNPETGKIAGPAVVKQIQQLAPGKDLRRFKTCALVGNGPGLRNPEDKLGKVIDKHDAVFKFNLYNLGERPGRMSDANTEMHGEKSNFRIFNKKRSQAAIMAAFALRPAKDEAWLWWHMGSGTYIKDTHKINPLTYFYSPGLVKWMVDVYFKLRSDMYRIGMAGRGFDCPVNLPSGVHSVLLASQMCDSINMFGFSFNMDMLRSRSDGPSPRVSSSHSWAFDTSMLQLLALSGRINICTV